MCGIAGFITKEPLPDIEGVLSRMTSAILHRGPDDEGYFTGGTRDGQYSIGLGHRRLSIIDLSGGKQPISNEAGTIQIVFNGEIYNFPDLRRDLAAAGHTFSTASDTETIVHAYEEYGDACVERLHGMFAFALWDANSDRLLLARDRFGKKPLYLYSRNGTTAFVSEIKALFPFPGIRFDVDYSAVFEYFAFRYVPGPGTLFSTVRKLMPGTCAVWEKGRLRHFSYYSPPDGLPRADGPTPPDTVETFSSLLDKAVRVRMVSDVPYGAFLSGGIDSSAVVALMTRHSSCPVKTFSVGFAQREYSELHHARTIADAFRTEHHELIITERQIMDTLPSLIGYRDAPVAEPSDIPIYFLAREASRTVKMVLTGEGGDEILGGYPKSVFEQHANLFSPLAHSVNFLIRPLIDALPYSFRRIKTAVRCLGIADRQERLIRWFGALDNREREALVTVPAPQTRPEYGRWNRRNSPLRQMLFFDQQYWLPDNLLERGDRMTMAASIEARMPLLDHELAAFVSALPDAFRVRGRQTKWILRQAVASLLPPSIPARPKVGFRVPVNEWFRGPMREYLHDHLSGPGSLTNRFYHRAELDRILVEHDSGRQNHEKLLWTLLNLEIWFRLNVRQ
ncbi:MAG: asparagine synthase (glutamine-hydrolyzing) [Desulfobacteraceae bacterium]|nr:asparagine synthase (glutamine-hydrolyzing) [Desulfobacteraceae bacterium]